MNTLQILRGISTMVRRAGGMIIDYFEENGVGDKARDYIKIATVGAQYLDEILEIMSAGKDDPAKVLYRTPVELWNRSGEIEESIRILKRVQLEKLKEK